MMRYQICFFVHELVIWFPVSYSPTYILISLEHFLHFGKSQPYISMFVIDILCDSAYFCTGKKNKYIIFQFRYISNKNLKCVMWICFSSSLVRPYVSMNFYFYGFIKFSM